jgi:HEAT repeat protein
MDIQDLADLLWSKSGFEIPSTLFEELLKDIIHEESCIQKAAACSLVSILKESETDVKIVLDQLLEIYEEKLVLVPAVLDQFNREIVPAIDLWSPRSGVAVTISQISQFFDLDTVEKIIQFMVSKGLRDRQEIVHKEMLNASLAIVDLHGKDCVATLLPVFEQFLDKAPNNSEYDNIRQAVVILMGSLARHLDKEDKRIEPIVHRLLAALSTPSQQVQEAVANCIPHLIVSMKDQAPQVVKKLMNQLVKSDKYGERRGAAYGIAGLVKGLGILSLKQLDIMSKLTTHIQDKKNYKAREGALFAFEMLCSTLGRLFEPYIVHILPHLLTCFGDSSIYVREAADETAKVVMRKLSAHGVKLVLPSLLAALDDESWRTKIAATELLGAMSHCAPKQLSSCLPSIVPKLMEILGDSHIKVQEAGGNALKMIGSVIKNPEIQAIVPILLRALEDPANKTSSCLQSLLKTKFVHFVDAPSLALIMPVVQRAFMDRSTETRKMAAQIIGNMYSLTDPKDLTPYLDNVMPGEN